MSSSHKKKQAHLLSGLDLGLDPSAVTIGVAALVGLLLNSSLGTLASETLTLTANNAENALEGPAPDHQATLHLGPLLLAEDTVGGAVNKELGLQLRQLTLNETGTDGVDNPDLDFGGGNAQSGGDGSVGERARGGGRCQRGEGKETDLALQGIGGLGEDTAGDGGERGGGNESLVGLEGVRGEDLEQLEESAVAGTEGLDGIGGSQGSEVEDGGAAQSSGEGANGKVARFGLADVRGIDGAQGLHDVRLGELLVTGGGGGFGDSDVQLAGIAALQLPG